MGVSFDVTRLTNNLSICGRVGERDTYITAAHFDSRLEPEQGEGSWATGQGLTSGFVNPAYSIQISHLMTACTMVIGKVTDSTVCSLVPSVRRRIIQYVRIITVTLIQILSIFHYVWCSFGAIAALLSCCCCCLGELGLDDMTEFVDRSKSPSSPQPTYGVDESSLRKVPSPHLYHRAGESRGYMHTQTRTHTHTHTTHTSLHLVS